MEKVKRTTEVASNIVVVANHCHDASGHYTIPRTSRRASTITSRNTDTVYFTSVRRPVMTTTASSGHSTVADSGADDPPAILPPPVIHVGDFFRHQRSRSDARWGTRTSASRPAGLSQIRRSPADFANGVLMGRSSRGACRRRLSVHQR